MSGAAPNPNVEPVWTLFLFMAVLVFAGVIVWALFRIQMLEALRYLRLGELWIIGLFTDQQTACYAWLKQAPVGNITPTLDNIHYARNCFGGSTLNAMMPADLLDFYELSGHSIAVIGRVTGYYLHWPAAAFFIGVGIYTIFFSPRSKFRNRYDLEGFIKIQSKMWPVISPIVNFKPTEFSARVPGSMIPDKLPPFAEALSPEEWISWHRIAVTNGIPDREAGRRAFILQLGPRWHGLAGQPDHIRALYAAFMLKGAQKREESDHLLGRLSTCWTIQGGLRITSELMTEVEHILRDKAMSAEAEPIGAQHAYRTTAMLGTLKWARSMGGVLAPAQFLWLRAADRALWYPMDNLGRRSFHVEGSGAMAHFMAEESAKKPLPIPRVDTAIVAINQFLASPEKHPIPIPPREELRSKT